MSKLAVFDQNQWFMTIRIVAVFIFTTVLAGCEKDHVDINEKPSPTDELITIAVDDLRSLVPLQLFKAYNKSVVINKDGDIREFNIDAVETYVDKTTDGIAYQAESISFTYIDPLNSSYLLIFEATGNYAPGSHDVFRFISCETFATINHGYSAVVVLDGHGIPQFAAKHDTVLTLLNNTFSDVSHNNENPSIEHFSKVYYSPSQGIVAFNGYNNELWVLESFE
jgi:hypothetical protein